MKRLTIPNHLLLPEVEQLLKEGIEVTLKVKGNSMLPFIEGERDSVVLTKTNNPQKGDVVLARLDNGSYVLHRIVAIRSDEFILMGDGNLRGTECCCKSHISGKVVKIYRDGRFIEMDSCFKHSQYSIWYRLRAFRRYLLAVYFKISSAKKKDKR